MLFTVEQLELIRRLRTTGISPDQISKAFTELEKVQPPPAEDEEEEEEQEIRQKSVSPPAVQKSEVLLTPRAIYAPILVQHLTSPINNNNNVITTPSTSPKPPQLVMQTVPEAAASSSSVGAILEHPICSSAPRPIRSQRTPMKEITTLDNPAELEEFMRQGEEACIGDMKTFITQYSLRQTTVAMMTGVSQPYISKLLNGNHRELSLRCRKNIYCWYLNCRRHPQKLAAFLADPASRLETNCDGELVPQRRERYVFRPILIRMLENFFAQTPFPDLSRRVEIATACNHILQLDKKGIQLMPKEIVSPQVVSNWFANKRKELRRKSAENASTATGSGSGSGSGSTINDSVSVSSMSPESREEADDETMSRTTTPDQPQPQQQRHSANSAAIQIATTSPCPMPFDLSLSQQPPAAPQLLPTQLDIFQMAQRLGLQFPAAVCAENGGISAGATAAATPLFLPAPNPFFNFQLMTQLQ